MSAIGDSAVSCEQPTLPLSGLGVQVSSYNILSGRIGGEESWAPEVFAAFCRRRRAAGIQIWLGRHDDAWSGNVHGRLAELNMYLEGIVRLPARQDDLERFEAEIRTAKRCGAKIVRAVLSWHRRYEVWSTDDEFRTFVRNAEKSLKRAEPVVRKYGIKLAVENHKDCTAAELAVIMRKFDSEYVGVCFDTGNNIALLEDPLVTAEVLSEWVFTVHLKDMDVEESREGFLLSEVPLGRGMVDLKGVVGIIRRSSQDIHFNLEMIARDPLSIPCLVGRYWSTLEQVSGRDLARTLAWVRTRRNGEPLFRIGSLIPKEQLEVEDRFVLESMEYVVAERLLD